jgi:hypothetical protein
MIWIFGLRFHHLAELRRLAGYAESIGYYEGDVPAIDTVGVKIEPFTTVDMYGTPHSPVLCVVENAAGCSTTMTPRMPSRATSGRILCRAGSEWRDDP